MWGMHDIPSSYSRRALPAALYTAEQVRELDRRAIQAHGIPGRALMERAGAEAFTALRRRWPRARRIAVLCGGGNNGGDGYVLARLAHQAGFDVALGWLVDPRRLRGDAAAVAETARAAGVVMEPLAAGQLPGREVLVDALLGTGAHGEVRASWREAIELVNAGHAGRFAIDIPSGLHPDTGAVLGEAVRADLTVTFIGMKQGLLTGAGPDRCGELKFAGLGVPQEIYAGLSPSSRLLSAASMRRLLPRRRRDAHKGDFGHVLVVGGGPGMPGAVRMCSEAAARVGAGLVTVATHPQNLPAVAAGRPECMLHGVSAASDIEPALRRASVVAVGPGLGRDPWARQLLDQVLARDLPMVVDADALNLLAEAPRKRARWVLTPHPGEAGRLLGESTPMVQVDRFDAAARLVQRYGGALVLKGAGTLVCAEDVPPAVCREGNPGMAAGGMGDVLSGVIAGLLAQGMAPADAARSGVWLHARAGDLAAAQGERGTLAGDLMAHLRRLVNPEPDDPERCGA